MLFPDVNDADLDCLYHCVKKLPKFPLSVDHANAPHVFSPPCDRCIRCQSQLASYNSPVRVEFYHVNGASKSVKVSLKCNRCGIYYGYSKYGNPTSGWNLYESPRVAVEARPLMFVLCTEAFWDGKSL